jgi:hypothetical protein
MLQLLDVSLGALAALRSNRISVAEYSTKREDLVNYFLSKTGWPSTLANCPVNIKSLNRWNARPKALLLAEKLVADP